MNSKCTKSTSCWFRWLNLFLAITLITAVSVLVTKYKLEVRSLSNQMTAEMQSWASGFWSFWFWIYAGPMYGAIKYGQFILLFYLREKNCALKIFAFMQLASTINENVKLGLQDSRPCFEVPQFAEKGGCSCSYGMPSGHSDQSTLFYLLLFTELFAKITNKMVSKAILLILSLFVIFNICVSRIYFGAHFLDQVLIGFSSGYLSFSLAYLFQTQIDAGMQATIEKFESLNLLKMTTCLCVVILSTMGIVASWILWSHDMKQLDMPTIVSLCKDKCLGEGVQLADRHLLSLAVNTALFGIFIVLTFTNYANTLLNQNYYKATLGSFSIFIKRLIVFIIVASPILVGEVIAATVKKAWIVNIVRSCLALVFGVLFVFVQKKLLVAFDVAIVGDYFVDEGFEYISDGHETEMVEKFDNYDTIYDY